MQKELEDILKFYDLIYLQYSTANTTSNIMQQSK